MDRFREVGSQADITDPLVIAKFFTPDSGWTWFATEFDEKDLIFFGYVIGPFPEWGTFSLTELLQTRAGYLKLPIEREIHFDEQPVSQLREYEW